MKKIMILGAGIYQVPLIKQAKEMGLYVIVLSYPGNYPGFLWADKVHFVDTTDIAAVLSVAHQEDIDGICTTGTDIALPALGKVVDDLGLCGPSYEAAIMSTNKKEMKKEFITHGVRTARFKEVKDISDCYKTFNVFNKPVMFKAVDSSGSRGIVKVFNENEIENAFQTVKNVTKLDYFLLEEFIDGIEFGAQAFVFNQELKFVLPHGDMVFWSDSGVPIGHYVPYDLPEHVMSDIFLQLEKSIHALKINNCAINADFILFGNDVFVLEIGARAGATCLPEMVSTYYDFNYYEQIINVSIGKTPNFSHNHTQACGCEIIMAPKDGVISDIKINREGLLNYAEDILDISFDYKIGEKVRRFAVGPDRIGQIIVKGKEIGPTLALLNKVKENVEIIIE